ncbi:MAG: sortase [Minisyncoccia bacterium]
MERIVNVTVRLVEAGKRAYARKWNFFGVFVVVFFVSVFTLGKLDLLPQAPAAVAANPTVSSSEPEPIAVVELPTKIDIPSINLSVTIANPTTIDIEALDKDLLKGAVRYPTSASLGEAGNVVLFGHSSYLPVVGNQAYKTFNGIQKLVVGDTVIVSSGGTAYTYRVRTVMKESAASNAGISLVTTERVLTLVTCNSFATKENRFVVTADFVESHSVST